MTDAITIDEKRLARITTLKSGGHSGIRSGACIMEAVAYVRRQRASRRSIATQRPSSLRSHMSPPVWV